MYIDDLKPSDMSLAPAGIPHSIQGLDRGCEFLLVFDDGSFSENETYTDHRNMAHTPKSVLAKNSVFRRTLQNIPKSEKSICSACLCRSRSTMVQGRNSRQPTSAPSRFMLGTRAPLAYDGGSIKKINVTDCLRRRSLRIIMEIKPGGVRELHWHPDADESQCSTPGRGTVSPVFDATSKARTLDFARGMSALCRKLSGHYIENLGTTTLRCINVFNKPNYKDVSLNNWMALTPPDLVQGL